MRLLQSLVSSNASKRAPSSSLFLLSSLFFSTLPPDADGLLLSTKGEAYSAKFALPTSGLPALPCGRSLQLKTLHNSGILGASLWPAAAPLCAHLKKYDHSGGGTGCSCIELGAGTGAVGLFAAAALGHNNNLESVVLTDLRPPPESAMYTTDGSVEVPAQGSDTILELLRENARDNRDLFGSCRVTVEELDWTHPEQREAIKRSSSSPDGFGLVLCSDVTHFTTMHQPLASTIAGLLHPQTGVCLLSHQERMVALNGRDRQLQDFVIAAQDHGLRVESIDTESNGEEARPVSLLRIRHEDTCESNPSGLVF